MHACRSTLEDPTDNAHLLLRYEGEATGMLWCSQVAVGNANSLRLRVYGERGGLEWSQETPEVLRHTPLGEPARLIRRGDPGLDPAATRATRVPAGHPEGYLEAFAQLYADAAEVVGAWREGRAPDPSAALVPGVADGVAGVRFVEAAVASDRNGGAWTPLDRGVTG